MDCYILYVKSQESHVDADVKGGMHLNRERARKYLAAAFVIFGGAEIIGSIGACENGEYTILQCVVCAVIGVVLVYAEWSIGKEE